MFPIRYVTETLLPELPRHERSFEREIDRFRQLDTIVTAQFAANQAIKYAYRNLCDRGCRVFSYFERHWVLTDRKAMDLAQRVLQKRYGDVVFSEIDAELNQISITWNGTVPEECNPEEAQERRNGKLFTYVATNLMEKAEKQIGQGANPNAKGPFGRTPIYAVMQSPSQLEVLIRRGARVDVVDDFGMTPLDVANVFDPDSEFAKVLQRHGATKTSSPS